MLVCSTMLGHRSVFGRGDEVDQFFDSAEQRHLEIGPGGDLGEDLLPEFTGRSAGPERLHHAFFPWSPMGDIGPSLNPDSGRLHGLPDVNEWMAADLHVEVVDLSGDVGLLGTLDQMVEQHTESPVGAGPKPSHAVGEVVGAVELLNHHAFDPQIVAPDPLDQCRVVDAFDPLAVIAGSAASWRGMTSLQGTPLPSMSARTEPGS